MLLAFLAFDFFEALLIRWGNLDVPSQLVQTIPYLTTVIGLAPVRTAGAASPQRNQRRADLAGPVPPDRTGPDWVAGALAAAQAGADTVAGGRLRVMQRNEFAFEHALGTR
ncbi:MAG: hypothetical protein ABJA16_11815 [Nakamurella sp.]